jgi:pathogenesis-related protein 1
MALAQAATAQQPFDAEYMLYLHNVARQEADPSATTPIADLAWDPALARSAAAFAAECRMGHSGAAGVGENNFYSSSTAVTSPEAVVNSWVSERQFYDIGANACANGRICGHYTQVVWAGTTHVGCGVAICDPPIKGQWGQKWVCQYAPPGNYVDQRPYEPQW